MLLQSMLFTKNFIPSKQVASTIFLVLTVFFIPISPTLKSIFLPLAALLILAQAVNRQRFYQLLPKSWVIASVSFFILVLLASLWSPANKHIQLIFVEKYSKVLYLPILALGFINPKTRTYALMAFLWAMLITAFLSFIKTRLDAGAVFHNHIITGNMMALAAYIAGWQAFRSKRKFFYLIISAVFSYQILLINTGRTGYFLYFILMLLLLFQHLSIKKLIPLMLGFCLAFLIVSYYSPVISLGLHQAQVDWQHYHQGETTSSLGYRLVFHHFAQQLFLSSPWIGQGLGGFATLYAKVNTEAQWQNLLDPHSQYWLIAADLGLLGIFALLFWLFSLTQVFLKLKNYNPFMTAVLVSFLLTNFSDSQLLYSSMGNLFIVFFSMGLGESLAPELLIANDKQ